MTEASWSRCHDADCIRLGGVTATASVEVRPGGTEHGVGFPPMAGAVVPDGEDRVLRAPLPLRRGHDLHRHGRRGDGGGARAPRDGAARHDRGARDPAVRHRGAAQFPAVLRGLLRAHERGPGRQARPAARRGRGGDGRGAPAQRARALGPRAGVASPSCWIPPGSSAAWSVTESPATPCEVGGSFKVVVDGAFPDARGLAPASRRRTALRGRRRRAPPRRSAATGLSRSRPAAPRSRWSWASTGRSITPCWPAACRSETPAADRVDGVPEIGAEERSWRLVPEEPWAAGQHQLVVDPVLEDLAGNSVSRVFDRDLFRPEDDPGGRSVEVGFRAR